MTLKNAALLAVIGMILMTALLIWTFVLTFLNVLRDLVPAVTLFQAVSSASWNGTGFSLGGISFPVTIPAGQSVPFTVTFAPQTTGPVNGTVSFLSNASNSPTNETLGGSGVQATPHSVGLSWNPDASTVQGYYVYRGAQTGGPYAKISTLQPGTSYVDAGVLSGQTYHYVVTALGTNSQESAYSNEAVAVIP
jgi:hypothetical protein